MLASATRWVAPVAFCAACASDCSPLLGLPERDLHLSQVQQRFGVVRLRAGEHGRELHRRDAVAALAFVVQRLRHDLVGRARLGIEFGISDEVSDAVGHARMVGEILVDDAALLGVHRAQVLHERYRRVGIVTRARHQQQPVLVGLQLVLALDLRDVARLCELAEAVHERREHRAEADQERRDVLLVLQGHGVPAFVVPRLVPDDGRELVVGLHEVERPLIDVDVAAHRRERVDVAAVEDLDVVRDVFACDLGPQRVRDVVDPRVHERVVDDPDLFGDFLVACLARLNFLAGRNAGASGCRDAGTHE